MLLINQNPYQDRTAFGSKAGRTLVKDGTEILNQIDKLNTGMFDIVTPPKEEEISALMNNIDKAFDKFDKSLTKNEKFDEVEAHAVQDFAGHLVDFAKNIIFLCIDESEVSKYRCQMVPTLKRITEIGEAHGAPESFKNPRKCTEKEDLEMLKKLHKYELTQFFNSFFN